MTRTIRIEQLLDRGVIDRKARRLGRIHEIVVERHGGAFRVREYRLGSGAIVDRFRLTRWIFGRTPTAIVVRADELVITRGSAPCIFKGDGKASD